MKRTTIELRGKAFPLYETKRGYVDFENIGFTIVDIQNMKQSALCAFVFFSAKACAKRENINFPFRSLDEFIDDDSVEFTAIATAFTGMVGKENIEEQGEAQPVDQQ
jgi:hypothetical protein